MRDATLSRSDFVAIAAVGLISVSAAYEAAVAMKWIPVGTVPGEGARFEGPLLFAASIAALIGVVLCLAFFATAEGRHRSAVPLAAVTAALMVAHYYTFDTYYLPTLTRYSDAGEPFSSTWVYSVATASVLASVLAFARPRVGFACSAVTMVLSLFTIAFAGFGK